MRSRVGRNCVDYPFPSTTRTPTLLGGSNGEGLLFSQASATLFKHLARLRRQSAMRKEYGRLPHQPGAKRYGMGKCASWITRNNFRNFGEASPKTRQRTY